MKKITLLAFLLATCSLTSSDGAGTDAVVLDRTTHRVKNPIIDFTNVTLSGISGTGLGSVSSVALAAPNVFSISGSPVTTTGTLTLSMANQSANRVWAGPSTGSAAAPTFRALVAADIPDLSATYVSPSGVLALGGFSSITGRIGNANLPLGPQLYDNAGTPKLSLDANARILYASDGTTSQINYLTPGEIAFAGSTYILGDGTLSVAGDAGGIDSAGGVYGSTGSFTTSVSAPAGNFDYVKYPSSATAYFVTQPSSTTYNGTPDPQLNWNYNRDPVTGSRIDNTDFQIRLALEANYNNGSHHFIEYNLDTVSPDLAHSRRWMYLKVIRDNSATPMTGDWQLWGDTFQLGDYLTSGDDTTTTWFSVSHTDATSTNLVLKSIPARSAKLYLNTTDSTGNPGSYTTMVLQRAGVDKWSWTNQGANGDTLSVRNGSAEVYNVAQATGLLTLANNITVTGGTLTLGSTAFTASTIVRPDTATTYTAGIKQTFGANATNAGVRLAGVTADPSTIVAGDLWYRSDTEEWKYRGASTTRTLANLAGTQTLTNKTIDGGSNTLQNINASSITTPWTSANAPVGAPFIASVTGVSLTTANGTDTTVFTVPAGKTFVCTNYYVTLTTVTGYSATNPPTFALVESAGGNNVCAAYAGSTSFSAANKIVGLGPSSGGGFVTAAAASLVKFRVTTATANTSTNITARVDVYGFYY